MTFTYVDARAVAQRLDDVLGFGGWQFENEAVVIDGKVAVHGKLKILSEGVWLSYEDFGCPNSAQDDEPLKSAASDALRRCAAQKGVARYLYSSGSAAPLSVAPRAVSVDSVSQSQPSVLSTDVAVAAAMLFAEGECPDHRTPWAFKPAGVSKAGKAYNAFYACGGKTDGQFCKRKPSIAWVNAQQQSSGEPERNENDLESLPF